MVSDLQDYRLKLSDDYFYPKKCFIQIFMITFRTKNVPIGILQTEGETTYNLYNVFTHEPI